MSTKPFRGAGSIYRRQPSGDLAFLGSCFAFRQRHVYLTAAHCIGSLNATAIVISTPFQQSGPWQVTNITTHPTADLAALEIDPAGTSYVEPFYGLSLNATFGTDIAAIGFPEDSTTSDSPRPTARYFKGNIQRLLHYKSPLGYEYDAAELSFGAPAGLSGGPVFVTDMAGNLVGLVCENFESSTYLRSIEEVQEGASVYKEKVHSVINYAICVRIGQYEQWLNSVAGPGF